MRRERRIRHKHRFRPSPIREFWTIISNRNGHTMSGMLFVDKASCYRVVAQFNKRNRANVMCIVHVKFKEGVRI